MPLPSHLLPTTVVGSYPQPDWLVDRALLSKVVPRTRMREIWRVREEFLEQAQDDATLLAIRDMEGAGVDIITDGEMRRESYSNRFATALEGLDLARPGEVRTRSGQMTPVPRVVGRIRRTLGWLPWSTPGGRRLRHWLLRARRRRSPQDQLEPS